ncbi:MAG: ABC transporter permease [Acetobacterales bacterium]
MAGSTQSPSQAAPRRSRFSLSFGLWRMPYSVSLSAAFLILMLLVALFAPLIAPFHYEDTNLLLRLKPPSFLGGPEAHLLGTDDLGRDVLSRLIYAIRISIMVALLGTAIGAVLGTLLGFVAAHSRGWSEEVIMMMVDWQAAMPFLIIALAVLAFFGNSLLLFLLLMGIAGWETYARLTRGLVLAAKEQPYAIAARSFGARPLRVYGRHILPNIVSALIVQVTLNFPDTILLETSLSFLGLGIQPPLTSLGLMLGSGRDYLLFARWMTVFPGAVIFLTTLSMSIVGDWARDKLDPTIQD